MLCCASKGGVGPAERFCVLSVSSVEVYDDVFPFAALGFMTSNGISVLYLNSVKVRVFMECIKELNFKFLFPQMWVSVDEFGE